MLCGRCNNNSSTIISAVHTRQQKGWIEGSGKPLLCIFSYRKASDRGGGESNVSTNP